MLPPPHVIDTILHLLALYLLAQGHLSVDVQARIEASALGVAVVDATALSPGGSGTTVGNVMG